MIDTVKLTPACARFRPDAPLVWQATVYPGAETVAPTGRVYGGGAKRRLQDRRSGLRVYGDREGVWSVECSLPRLGGGSNGRLIVDQAELDVRVGQLFERLREVADVEDEGFRVSRLDLVQHLPVDPADLVAAYRDFTFPGIQKAPAVRAGQSISWTGTDLSVVAYDKAAERRVDGPGVTRLEFRLTGGVLRREFGGDVTRLDFAECYGVYRRLAGRLEPKRLPRLSKVAELLAYAEQQGVEVVPFWIRGKSAPTVRKVRREVAAARLDYAEINVLGHLPADRPPEPIHVGPEGSVEEQANPNPELEETCR